MVFHDHVKSHTPHSSHNREHKRHRGGPLESQEDEFNERRREERERIGEAGFGELWAMSPKAPEVDSYPDDSAHSKKRVHGPDAPVKPKKRKKSKKTHKHTSTDTESDNDSPKKKKKNKKKSKKKHKHQKHKSKKAKKKDISSEEESQQSGDGLWEEKRITEDEPIQDLVIPDNTTVNKEGMLVPVDDDGDHIIGPLPSSEDGGSFVKPLDYGHALLPGEGAAMAAFVLEGKRIPRRGEIGLRSDEITSYEDVGYVMSGSRHRRMEAVRLRKENQIYSADEKRALASFNRQERDKRESRILTSFRELVKEKLQ